MEKKWLVAIGIVVLLVVIAASAFLFVFRPSLDYRAGMAEAYDRYYGTMGRYSTKYTQYLPTLTPIYQGSASKDLQLYVYYRAVASMNESESTTIYRNINITELSPDLITRILLFFNKTEGSQKDPNLDYVLGEKVRGKIERGIYDTESSQEIAEKESTPSVNITLKNVTVKVFDDPLFKEDYNVLVNFDFNHATMMAGRDPFLQVSGKTFGSQSMSSNSTIFAYIVPKSDWTNNVTLSFVVRDFDAEDKYGGWQVTQRSEVNVSLS